MSRQESILVAGAREHNLKDVTVALPRDSLVVITGLSGSGKSSLAFDTIYAEGVLQDTHWGGGLIGYFPTYTIGNLMAAQLWERLEVDVEDIWERIEQGDFAPLREWLRANVHVHGRKLYPRELLRRVTGEELRVDPFVGYLRAKLEDAGLLAPA